MFLWKLYNKYYYNIYSRRNKYFRPYGINIIIFFSLEHTFCNSYSIWNLDYYSSTLLCFFFFGRGVLSRSEIFVCSPFWVRSCHIYMVEEKKMALSVYLKPFIYKHGIPELLPNWSVEFSAFRIPELKFLNIFQKHPDFPTKTLSIFY